MSEHEHEEVHFRPQLGGGASAEPPPPSVPVPPSPAAAREPAPATAANPKNPNDPRNYDSADEYARVMSERYPHIHATVGWETMWREAHARAAAARAEYQVHAQEHMSAIAHFPTPAHTGPTGPKFCR